MRPTTYRKKPKPAPPIDLAKVQAAVQRLAPNPPPSKPVSHAGKIPEDVARRGYYTRPILRQCYGIHLADFQ